MTQDLILNSPFEMPSRYFNIVDGEPKGVMPGRRPSDNLMPVPPPKKRGPQQQSFVKDGAVINEYINRVRERVALWRRGRYEGATRTSRQLLEYWSNPARENKLFWCQIEALETVIFLTEVAHKRESADRVLVQDLKAANQEMNPTLYRLAFKMATGAGKTVVMGMLIAWQTLNRQANRKSPIYSDQFLIVTPGLTIRDRLQVLQPNHPDNYYKQRDILPPDLYGQLQQAKIEIINYHKLMLKKDPNAPASLGQELLQNDFTETPAEMVARVCSGFDRKREILVLNDEAHHCYRPREEEVKIVWDEKSEASEAKKQSEEARLWLNGIEAIKQELGVKAVYDLSATPAFLKGQGYPEASIFPWVVSDFSLLDAIESGIVKVPRLPVADDRMGLEEQPMYRELWPHIKDDLKPFKPGTKYEGAPPVPKELQAAIQQLYGHYEDIFKQWEQDSAAQAAGQTAPVFIVVCNNTAVSKLVYDFLSGWQQHEQWVQPPMTPLFSNVEAGQPLSYPNTILVDSKQLESGEGLDSDFKALASVEIEEFKIEYRRRNPGADVEKISEAELLREVMNTVGKRGKLGERVRCVVSVSMLTEGWDCQTVTHILGVRAFGTQLLCEQVVGRALRRISYATQPDERGKLMFTPEYAEVFGVPFRVMLKGGPKGKRTTIFVTHVTALPERQALEITFPHVVGYKYESPDEPLTANFTESHKLTLTLKDIATRTTNAAIFGDEHELTLDKLRARRVQEVDFLLAKLLLEKYYRLTEPAEFRPEPAEPSDAPPPRFRVDVQSWRFPELIELVRQWREQCLRLTDGTFPQMLLLIEYAHDAAERINSGIIKSQERQKQLKPLLRSFDQVGTTADVDFDTTKQTYDTRKSHVNRVTMDSGWEAQLAEKLEHLPQVISYVKNDRLNFKIPYTLGFKERDYLPDFIARVDDGNAEPLNLIIEVSGERRTDKETKVATARNLWIPAVNAHGGFGRWAFVEIRDIETATQELENFIQYGETRPMLIALADKDR